MDKPSWLPTLVAQLSLVFALFLALKLGQPQKKFLYNKTSESRPLDLYFISIRGGFRPFNQQTHLLKQVDMVAKAYKARFVVSISEFGADDPLMKNATRQFSSLKIPWYTTRVSKEHDRGYFLKQVKMPYGKTLDIIGVNTGLLQDSVHGGSIGETGNNQLNWLRSTLGTTISNWRIAVGFHPLVVCEETDEGKEAKEVFETLHQTFMKFEVVRGNVHQGGIAYIGNPGPIAKGPYLALANGRSVFRRELDNGFLLHRVSSLEIVTYFVSSAGEVVHRTVLQQRGREVV
ncbi:hypothetical protein FEM48_Zijuj01G0175400 [Ziziphus jujuba var. spinosa]|uniref:Uncharacterized protein n=1 Tax=Ziziphus jujuba var. spinosa TaxID=714518 RepID=A0A978W2L6_ZIZJJ|nr:hypothetical protein FEM48_Zijuj01G0175400 [Ziziphus jujuba var. spinosa]